MATVLCSRTPTSETLASTSIEGLDDILKGRFTSNRLRLLQGAVGSEKTPLMQFLMEGVHCNEPALYV